GPRRCSCCSSSCRYSALRFFVVPFVVPRPDLDSLILHPKPLQFPLGDKVEAPVAKLLVPRFGQEDPSATAGSNGVRRPEKLLLHVHHTFPSCRSSSPLTVPTHPHL